MLICRIERCDTLLCTTIAIYRRITITPSDGFTSSCSSTGIYSIPEQVFILAAATIVHLFRTSRRTSAQCRLLCSIRLDSCDYGRELSLISQSHLLFIDRISRVCCLHLLRCTTPWLPVSPGHRIASHHITTGPELSTEPDRVLPGRQEPEGPKTRLALLTPALRIFLNFLVIFALPAVVVRHWRSTRFFCPPPPPVVAPFFLHHSLFFLFSSSLPLLSHPHPPIELSRVSYYSLLVLFFYCSLR